MKQWYKLTKDKSIKFLAQTHGDFFSIEGSEFCLNEKLSNFASNDAFIATFKDAIELRTLEYYKNRFESSQS